MISALHIWIPFALALSAAPTIPVERLDGPTLGISNFSEHRATAFVFLSTSDPDPELATIRRLNNRYRRRRVMFAALFPNREETPELIRAFCQASGFVFPCYRDPAQKAARQLAAKVTPETVLLDGAGEVVYRGAVAGLEAAIEDLVAGRPVREKSREALGTPLDHPKPPRPVTDPWGSISYASELIFEKIPGAAAHHASSITVAANGDLLVSWYGGSYESSDDEALYLARRPRGQRLWETPRMLLRNPRQPVGNAVIFTMPNGENWIIWGRMEASQPLLAHTGWAETRLLYRVSRDHGRSWSADAPFPMETTGWLPRNVAIRLASGAILVPISDERNNRDLSFFLLTRDNGAHWTRSANIPNAQSQGEQPAVAQRRDGSLLAFLRTAPSLLQTESSDDGLTWTPAQPTEFNNPDAAISLCALNNGNLILVWNNNERGRSPLHIARSTDNGKSWSKPLQLESNPGEYSYPSVIQTEDQHIHVIYTYRRYSIKHVEFDEAWLTRLERPD